MCFNPVSESRRPSFVSDFCFKTKQNTNNERKIRTRNEEKNMSRKKKKKIGNLVFYAQSTITVISGRVKKKNQELCESPGGRPGLSVLTSLLVSVDVKIY